MSGVSQSPAFFIGWDVGGWNCDNNTASRDAIVILDASLATVGMPWRGNLRTTINAATSSQDWIQALFALCGAEHPTGEIRATLAIDTPLGFSEEFLALVTGRKCAEPVEDSATNPYLYRMTERYLFDHGLRPLSAIKDMIGSQATKGMHALAKFAPHVAQCGVWTDGDSLTAIEAYPSACKGSASMHKLRSRYAPLGHVDKDDALTCAMLAYLYATQPEVLVNPLATVSVREGWIWVPMDALKWMPVTGE